MGELLARVRAALRQKARTREGRSIVKAGEVTVDFPRRLVTRAGEPVRLSPKEYELLARLIAGEGKVLTHKELLISVWGPAHIDDTQYLRVFVGQLRQKLEPDPSSPQHILTEPGIGYRFIAD